MYKPANAVVCSDMSTRHTYQMRVMRLKDNTANGKCKTNLFFII